jgi:hypothetical protein
MCLAVLRCLRCRPSPDSRSQPGLCVCHARRQAWRASSEVLCARLHGCEAVYRSARGTAAHRSAAAADATAAGCESSVGTRGRPRARRARKRAAGWRQRQGVAALARGQGAPRVLPQLSRRAPRPPPAACSRPRAARATPSPGAVLGLAPAPSLARKHRIPCCSCLSVQHAGRCSCTFSFCLCVAVRVCAARAKACEARRATRSAGSTSVRQGWHLRNGDLMGRQRCGCVFVSTAARSSEPEGFRAEEHVKSCCCGPGGVSCGGVHRSTQDSTCSRLAAARRAVTAPRTFLGGQSSRARRDVHAPMLRPARLQRMNRARPRAPRKWLALDASADAAAGVPSTQARGERGRGAAAAGEQVRRQSSAHATCAAPSASGRVLIRCIRVCALDEQAHLLARTSTRRRAALLSPAAALARAASSGCGFRRRVRPHAASAAAAAAGCGRTLPLQLQPPPMRAGCAAWHLAFRFEASASDCASRRSEHACTMMQSHTRAVGRPLARSRARHPSSACFRLLRASDARHGCVRSARPRRKGECGAFSA